MKHAVPPAPFGALQWFNAITLAIATTLAVTLGVVCLQYLVYLEGNASLQAEWPSVWRVTAVFALIALCAGCAFLGQRRATPWRAAAEIALLLALAGGGLVLYRVLS